MDVPQDKLEKILDFFDPRCRYLQKATLECQQADKVLKAQGVFSIGPTAHTKEPLKHVSAVEIQTCFHQLSYAALGIWAEEGKLPYKVSFDDFLGLMREHMYLREALLRFPAPILKENDLVGHLVGQIDLEYMRRTGQFYFVFVSCSIEEKFRGHLKFVLKFPQ